MSKPLPNVDSSVRVDHSELAGKLFVKGYSLENSGHIFYRRCYQQPILKKENEGMKILIEKSSSGKGFDVAFKRDCESAFCSFQLNAEQANAQVSSLLFTEKSRYAKEVIEDFELTRKSNTSNDIDFLVETVHEMAKSKGWWEEEALNHFKIGLNDCGIALNNHQKESLLYHVKTNNLLKTRSPLEIHALIISEIAEATEHVRAGNEPFFIKEGKPDGEAVELADAVIRIMDYFGKKGWKLSEVIKAKINYNATREKRHGGKKY